MIEFRTEKELIDLFQSACMAHTAVEYFNAGSVNPYAQNEQRDIEFPAVYLQTLTATQNDGNLVNEFRLHVFDLPASETPQNHLQYQYDDRLANSRDTAFQIFKDIIGAVRNPNMQDFVLETVGSQAVEAPNDMGTVGWAGNITITQDSVV